ncbi:unnamed protein product [Gongylonema pulchrum]|uniref:Protein kinase domain-containing protein n=1 Tax=Gongylonema pulchrum TaxID=637853 RepID=A0A3P7NAZ4_9BILA|nr:unnamed protein product [Gongylonema pulchrum]
MQVAKALEYLHEHRIIYRDLKCENVLTWRFPPPFSAITDVLVKLGDYGISRSSFPSGGAKGFGGTEGFMAPEIMRYNGEQEYTEKVAKALEYLHEHRIIYRDLKCENVLTWRFPPPFSAITDVLVKLGDYGISRSSFPSGGAKGFGGTEGFMAPEIMRYNGEQEYTEKVDCFSFAMFLYELISLKLPFDGHELLKEYVLDGGRPRLTPSELLYPCNVLDVMVVCWATQPVDRPSASQIVSMTTAPEFTHLLDVISLNDPDSEVNAGIAFPSLDDVEMNSNIEDSVEGEVWMSRSDGSITVLGCNQYGWLDSKSIALGTDRTVILAMCTINENVWLAESTGILRIYW